MKHYGEILVALRDNDFGVFRDSDIEDKFKMTGKMFGKKVNCILAYRADHNLTIIFEDGALAVVGCDTCQIHCDDLKITEDYEGKKELKLYKNGELTAECLMDYLEDNEEESEEEDDDAGEKILDEDNIEFANVVEVRFEEKEKYLFTRNDDETWHCEHWDRKGVWEYEEDDYTDSDVLEIVNDTDACKVRASLRIEL